LESILKESFELRMVSDVPVGVFLSGGVDSSLVTAILQKDKTQKINTFTIGFEDKDTNEAVWARKVAEHLGTNHTELYVNPKDTLELFETIPEMFDEPFGDNSAIPTYIVSKLAKQDVTVSLSADGGDELFGGYTNYKPTIKLYNILQQIPYNIRKIIFNILNNDSVRKFITNSSIFKNKKNISDKYKKLTDSILSKSILDIFDQSKSYWTSEDLNDMLSFSPPSKTIYKDDNKHNDLLNLVLLNDQKTYLLDDILTKIDRTTMFTSLEGREPFLDNKIVEFALSLPSQWKIRNGTEKYLLKQVLYRYLPKELVDRPKKGFGLPIQKWFRNELRPLLDYHLSKEKLVETGLFNVEFIHKELEEYYNGRNTNINKFWLILVYMQWREKWM
jgi:asparagine synthase (glutamine-hydrolysing)